MVLSIDSVQRSLRVSRNVRPKVLRLWEMSFGMMLTLILLFLTTLIAQLPLTAKTRESITIITLVSLLAAVVVSVTSMTLASKDALSSKER
jgi:hypothetical protein